MSVTGQSGEDSATTPSPPQNKMDDKQPSSSALSSLSPIFTLSKLMVTTFLPAEPAGSLEKRSRSRSGSESAREIENPKDIHKDTGASTDTTSEKRDWEHDVMMEEGHEDRRMIPHASASSSSSYSKSESRGPTNTLDTVKLPKRIVLRLPPVYSGNGRASKKSSLKREREEDTVNEEKTKRAKLTLGGRAEPKGVLKTSLKKTSSNSQRRVQWAQELEEWKFLSSESEWDYDEYEDYDDLFDSPWSVTEEDEGDEDGSENDDRSPSPSASWPNDVMTTLSESDHRILAEALDDLEDFFSPKPIPVIRHSLNGLNNNRFEKRAFRPQASSRFANVDAGVPKASGSEENRTTAVGQPQNNHHKLEDGVPYPRQDLKANSLSHRHEAPECLPDLSASPAFSDHSSTFPSPETPRPPQDSNDGINLALSEDVQNGSGLGVNLYTFEDRTEVDGSPEAERHKSNIGRILPDLILEKHDGARDMGGLANLTTGKVEMGECARVIAETDGAEQKTFGIISHGPGEVAQSDGRRTE